MECLILYQSSNFVFCTSLIHTRTGVPFDLGVSVGYDYHEYKSIKDTNLSPSMEFQFEYKKELTIKVLVVNEVVEAFNSTTHRLLLSTVIYDNYDGDTKIYKTKHKYYYYKDSASINKSLTAKKKYTTQNNLSKENQEDVIFEEFDDKGLITLNKPRVMNTLTDSMLKKINKVLRQWESTKQIVVIKGADEKIQKMFNS
ncbi:hypothetical protein HCN44_004287 [Aphidius gifuensis]|uniref:3-hydroxyisobutyryl-CoA hydrolase n=1 Tax=Aphidius gifuensis TaxID=684658 RepID=A0A834XWK8_APHGI|nr:hypothetical protein HCN44_004287 [Aphidius gifuensis]